MANAETPISTIAPPGIGRTIDPTMVAMKMAKRCQDWLVIPFGTGINRTIKPEANTIAHRRSLSLNERCWSEATAAGSTSGEDCGVSSKFVNPFKPAKPLNSWSAVPTPCFGTLIGGSGKVGDTITSNKRLTQGFCFLAELKGIQTFCPFSLVDISAR